MIKSSGAWNGITVQLRYSPACKAAWTKAFRSASGASFNAIHQRGVYYQWAMSSGSPQWAYTYMIDKVAGVTSHACVASSSSCLQKSCANYCVGFTF